MHLDHYSPSYLTENKSPQLLRIAVAFGTLETLFLVTFVIARAIKKTNNGIDYWLVLAAYIGCFCQVILSSRASFLSLFSKSSLIDLHSVYIKYGGVGRHMTTVSPREIEITVKLDLAESVIYPFSVMLPKLAILGLYLRLFTQRRYRYTAYGVAAILFLTWLAACFMTFLMCRPFAYTWDKSIPGGHCGDIMAAWRWTSLPNIATDVVMLMLPLPAIWNLHITLGQKVGLTLTFLTGSI